MALAVERTSFRFPNAGSEYGGRVYPNGWLSPSSINEYLSCPRCWEYNRILRYPKAMAVDLPIGGAVHKAVEHQRRRWLDSGPTTAAQIDEAVDAAAEHFERSLDVDEETGGEVLLDLKDFADVGAAKDAAVRIARFALPEIAKLDAKRGLIAAEVDIATLDVPDPYPFAVVGRIDGLYGSATEEAMDVTSGEDLKTSKKQEAPGLAAVIQTTLYDEFLGPIPWLVDVLAKTKTPSFQTYTATYSPEHRQQIRELVLDVAEQINRGYFPPRPGWACKFDHGFQGFSVAVAGFPE